MKGLLLYILIGLSSLSYSQDDAIIYSKRFECVSNCLGECHDSVSVGVRLYVYGEKDIFVTLSLEMDTVQVRFINLDIENIRMYGDAIVVTPLKNEFNVDWIRLTNEYIQISHRHSLFNRHTFYYHNNKS